MLIKLFPYKLGSKSANSLAAELGILRVRDTYLPKAHEFIINWGKSRLTTAYPEKVLNKPEAVARATNKLSTFSVLSDADYLPEWTTNKSVAQGWVEAGLKVYCRTSLTGHSGSGIVIASTVQELVDAPLYTRQVKSKYEYRIHVFKGEVIDVQQKKKRLEWDDSNTIPGIRNHANGWVYARNVPTPPSCVLDAALDAVVSLGLDFGAVDIAYNQTYDKAFLFEVNTAPGLEGTTLFKYVEAINNWKSTL
jgi:glutathione synthase/RimK-type ligase-like ATP-grasp enzyme